MKDKCTYYYRDVGHGAEIVYFMGLDFRDDVKQICGVRQISIVQE